MNTSIFIAEDDSDDYSLLEEAFMEIAPDLRLHWSRDGEELIASLRKLDKDELPVKIILDYNMPRLNGLETLKLLNSSREYQEIPKIIYTSGQFDGYKSEALAAGANGFFEKSTSFEEIRKDVERMLGV